MHRHLVAVKVRVERGADQRVQTDGAAFYQLRLKGLNTQPVQRRRTVQENRVIVDHLFHHVPDTGILTLDQLLRGFRIAGNALIDNFIDDKRLIQLNGHLTRNSALIHFQIRSDRNNGTA